MLHRRSLDASPKLHRCFTDGCICADEQAAPPLTGRARSLANLKRYPKGETGNPSGRPKIVEVIKTLARAHGGEAFKVVVGLLKSDDERVRMVAAQEILNRAYGKPTLAVDVTHKREPADFSDAELYAIARSGRASDEPSSRH